MAALIKDEAAHLRLLQRMERVALALQDDPASLTERLRRELHSAYEVISKRYYIGGATTATKDLGNVANSVVEAIGLVGGDQLLLSDGSRGYAEYGFTQAYIIPSHRLSPEEVISENTCDACRPNFEEMIRRDTATGHWAPSDASK